MFLAPFGVLFVLFFLLPIGYAIYESLLKVHVSGLGLGPNSTATEFAGLSNYAKVFSDSSFLSGVGRVLHSAAALRCQQAMRGKRLHDFQRAYRYIQTRRPYLRYAAYRRLGLPIGSGVTEAACKTLYTQRLKLSGMRWQKEGAQRILQLRSIWLSGVWSEVFDRMLTTQHRKVKTQTPDQSCSGSAAKAG